MIKSISLILAVLLLASCSQYQKHFGGKSGDYTNARLGKPLMLAGGADSLQPNHRYAIPNVAGMATDVAPAKLDAVDILPPDYN